MRKIFEKGDVVKLKDGSFSMKLEKNPAAWSRNHGNIVSTYTWPFTAYKYVVIETGLKIPSLQWSGNFVEYDDEKVYLDCMIQNMQGELFLVRSDYLLEY